MDRALRILDALRGRPMGLGEIAKQLELAPSTVHRIISTLVRHGMVEQQSGSKQYRLGPATLRLGNVYLDTLELRSRVWTWTGNLARKTGHAVRVGVLVSGDVLVIAHEPRRDGTRQMPETGIAIPAHACALGKALLAFAEDGAAQALARDRPLGSMTGKTITDHTTLGAALDAIRVAGIASEVEEAVLGECAVAAPLLEPAHHAAGAIRLSAAGAIGLVVPSTQWPPDPAAISELRITARAISRQLGAPI